MDKNLLLALQQASIYDVREMSEAERASLGYLVLVMRRWPQGFSWEALGLHLSPLLTFKCPIALVILFPSVIQ